MARSTKTLRAIDLYSGVGGWSLGLTMAGLEVVASYEWWSPANLTNLKNNRHSATEIDIRQLQLEQLPKKVDVVVGSPPCTQFSYSNRGGSGDIADGLKDVAKFLEIVAYIQPTYWAMENVPRVASILQQELCEGGRLEKYASLKPTIAVVDVCEWGVPQRRQRCIAGNFDFELLHAYRAHATPRTLGDVVKALAVAKAKTADPSYGIQLDARKLFDHELEECLSPEEERMNREMKTFHPVYNNMAFPDPLGRPGRTITATCTRVSRESVVIAAPEKKGRFRRLSVRERACLQGFPISYQFFGQSHAQKLKMVGNAVPPLFTFYIGQAMRRLQPSKLLTPEKAVRAFKPPTEQPRQTQPDTPGEAYPSDRRFRAAIPHLRFKSGVRFELSNADGKGGLAWRMRFFFGNSKNIQELDLHRPHLKEVQGVRELRKTLPAIRQTIAALNARLGKLDAADLQPVWSHAKAKGTHPYQVVDALGETAAQLLELLADDTAAATVAVEAVLSKHGFLLGKEKVLRHANAVLAGLFIGECTNEWLRGRRKPRRKGPQAISAS